MTNPFELSPGVFWAMKKHQLPKLMEHGDFKMCYGQRRHPSPEFRHVMVWTVSLVDTMAVSRFFEKHYGLDFESLVPSRFCLMSLIPKGLK